MTKKTGTGLLSMKDLQEKWALKAKDARARITTTGNAIGIRNSKFTYQSNVIGRELSCVVVDFVHSNTWYDTAFEPDNPQPPACQALSVDGDEMAPDKKSPNLQNETCDGCVQNAWGSADVGRGKACAQQYKLAVLAVKPGEDFSTCEMAILTLPPTSLKNWNKYVNGLDEVLNLPTSAVLTLFTFETDAEWPILEMKIDEKIKTPGEGMAILHREDEARKMLMTPPDFSGSAAPKKKTKKKARKKVSKKKVSKKKTKTTRKKKAGGLGSKFA